MDIYAANIMDHYKSPRHSGVLDDLSKTRHEANKLCGDVVDVDVKVESGKLKDVAFRGEGCAISQAGASILFDEVVGMDVAEIMELEKEDVYEMLGIHITARRGKCAVLGLLALQNALLDLAGENSKSFADILL